jgi:hypothetical protein
MCQCEMLIKKTFKNANWGHVTINTTYHNDRLLQLTNIQVTTIQQQTTCQAPRVNKHTYLANQSSTISYIQPH